MHGQRQVRYSNRSRCNINRAERSKAYLHQAAKLSVPGSLTLGDVGGQPEARIANYILSSGSYDRKSRSRTLARDSDSIGFLETCPARCTCHVVLEFVASYTYASHCYSRTITVQHTYPVRREAARWHSSLRK